MSGRDSDTNGDPLGTPTPGQIALSQPDFQPAYSEQRRSEGGTASASRPTGGLGDPTPGQTILRALQEQQDAMDTIRAGNRRQSVNEDSSESSELQGLNYNGNLSDLFKSPFSPPQGKDEDAIEFEEAGTYDFRKALLAEQRHQQAILQERQMSFDQQYGNSEASGTSPRPSPRLSPKLPPKMAPKADGHPVIVPKSSNSNPPSRPARITNKNRGISAPLGAAPASGPSHKHNRTVSWSLENLETFHSDDPVSDSPNDDAENHALRQSRSLSPTPMTGVGSHRSKAPSRMSLRARGLSEDHTSVNLGNQKINLQDIMGMAPFESEAETNILRALDEFAIQNQGNQREEGSGDAAFFANLPSDFSLSDDLLDSDSERAQPAVDGSPKAKKMDDASKTCMSTSTNHKKKPSDLSTGGLSTHSNYQPPPRPRLASAAMGVSSRQLQSNSSKSQRRFSTVRPRTHRHTQSVEQKLFGLTAQLSKLDGESLTSFHDDEDSLAEEEEKDRKAAQAYKHHRVFSSADKVAQTTHDLVKKAHRREASQLAGSPKKHPSLMRIRTESGDFDSSQRIDLSPDPGKFKRGPLSTILHPRPATPTGDIEAQQETASPTDDVDESNFSKWRRGRDSVSSHGDEGDTSLGFQSNRSNRSIGGASMAKKHHAPTVIDEGDESEGEDEPAKSEREKKSNGKTKRRKKRRSRNPKKILAEGLKEDWEMFNEFLSPRKRSMWLYCKAMLCFVVLPATGIAALLFYVFENPRSLDHNEESDAAVNNETDAAVNDEKNAAVIDVTKASVSWWILFLGVRQIVTLSLALATQSVLIDYICLGSRFSLQLVGPVLTLLLVQSKGWPFIITLWSLYDLGMLSGSNRFVRHWLFWQDWFRLFSESNPGGTVTENETYLQILRLAMIVGLVVAVKRLVVGLFLGRQTFVHYGEELAKVMKRMVLVGEVAALSREPLPRTNSEYLHDADQFEQFTGKNLTAFMSDEDGSTVSMHSVKDLPDVDAAKTLPKIDSTRAINLALAQQSASSANQNATLGGNQSGNPKNQPFSSGAAQSTSRTDKDHTPPPSPGAPSISHAIPTSVGGDGGVFTPTSSQTMMDLLERWEEPERSDNGMDKKVTLGAVLQFRRAIAFTKKRYPFSPAFGPADTREMCIDSAQRVYDRLLLRRPGPNEDLNFETLAVLATDSKGSVDEDKLKDLIKIFRPDRDGRLTRLAFCKSIDTVYKRLRLLSANIHNSSQIDVAVENIVNVGFYAVLGCVALSRLGIDPLQLFFSFSSVILAFAFMFGSGAAKYFEGVLLILIQRPFGVGDRIHVSNCQNDLSGDGQAGWIVEKVNLYNTTVCFGATNERATISNGSLASSRIINAARSPNAIIYVHLKFALDVPYEKIMIFRRATEQHVAARPREWLAFLGFRAGAISVDLGYITYKIVVQHREPWQQIISVLESKATLTTYCLEVAKQLDMRYRSPPLPVDLNVFNSGGLQISEELMKKNA